MAGDRDIRALRASAYTVPTDGPEADGTYAWSKTTLVLVEVEAADETGLGYTYADASLCGLIGTTLVEVVVGRDAFDIPGARAALQRHVRNLGRSGLCACALSAIDAALWDLKAKLLAQPLAFLLGRARDRVPVYGSGGFTTYDDERLTEQLAGWVAQGCRFVKMKIGVHDAHDAHRVEVARAAIGDRGLFVDANGAYDVPTALAFSHRNADLAIDWFEEPVTSDDPRGLRAVRDGAPPGMAVAAGEYIYTADDARHLLEAGAVDVLQADVTRCGGVSGFLDVAALCEAHHTDLSGHCAPSLHRHVACGVQRLRHVEWFHDHVRIEQMLFEGAPTLERGAMTPDLREPGHGLVFKQADAARFLVGGHA